MRRAASLAFSSSRAATITAAPASQRARAVSNPMPEFAPVTSAVLPVRSTPPSTSLAVLAKPNGVTS
jgi:hypothetical protein